MNGAPNTENDEMSYTPKYTWDDYTNRGDPFNFNMDHMTEQEAKHIAKFWISMLTIVSFLWTGVVYLWMQAFYLFVINRVMKPQLILEKHFMGPEVAAIPNSQAAIQTINVEQQQVQRVVYY